MYTYINFAISNSALISPVWTAESGIRSFVGMLDSNSVILQSAAVGAQQHE